MNKYRFVAKGIENDELRTWRVAANGTDQKEAQQKALEMLQKNGVKVESIRYMR